MNNLETTKQNTSLESIGDLSAADVLRHFNKNIYPQIKERFFSKPIQTIPVQTKKSIFNIFKKKEEKKEQTREERQEQNKKDSLINELFGAEVAKGIFELVIGDHTSDFKRISLFLETLYLEMTTTAYMNSWLDFNHCAKQFAAGGAKDKSRIIEESLKLCDQRFEKGCTTITFAEDHLIFKNGYGTTIQSKEDFFKEEE